MPHIYNKISGDKLIEEINDYSIDSRGKVTGHDEEGNPVIAEDNTQEINSNLNINGKLQVNDNISLGDDNQVINNKIIIPDLYKSNTIRYITEEVWNTLISSDLNLIRNDDGSIYLDKYEYLIYSDSGHLVENKSSYTDTLSKSFTVSDKRINNPFTKYDRLYIPSFYIEFRQYANRVEDPKITSGNIVTTIIKDNKTLDEVTWNGTGKEAKYHHTFYENKSYALDNINGTYTFKIKINIDFNTSMDIYINGWNAKDINCDFYLGARYI